MYIFLSLGTPKFNRTPGPRQRMKQLHDNGVNSRQLTAQLRDNGWTGEIVGEAGHPCAPPPPPPPLIPSPSATATSAAIATSTTAIGMYRHPKCFSPDRGMMGKAWKVRRRVISGFDRNRTPQRCPVYGPSITRHSGSDQYRSWRPQPSYTSYHSVQISRCRARVAMYCRTRT